MRGNRQRYFLSVRSNLLSNCRIAAYLSLDGGGVRGLSTLLILKSIFVEVARLDQEHANHHDFARQVQIARPCHYFDHMTGTSTGG